MSNHTKTPWVLDSLDIMAGNRCIASALTQLNRDCTGLAENSMLEAKANAAHIVHCVNNYDALVDREAALVGALKEFMSDLDVQALDMGDFTWIPTVEYEQAAERAEATLKALGVEGV